MTHLKQYPHSVIEQDGTTYALARAGRQKKLSVQGDTTGFTGETTNGMLLCPLTAENAAALRAPPGLADSRAARRRDLLRFR